MEMANPLLESFKEPSKILTTNSSRPLTSKGKEPDLPLVCSNYWPPIVALSLCFNHLAMQVCNPQEMHKPIASIHHTESILRENL